MKPLLQPFAAIPIGLLLVAGSAFGQEADLSASGSAPSPVLRGRDFSLTVRAENLGPSPAGNVTITVKLPLDATYVSGCAYDNPTRTVTCAIGPLGVSVSRVEYVVLQADASGLLAFDLSVMGTPEPDPVPTNNSYVVKVVANASSGGPVEFLTVRSSDRRNLLEWLNPPAPPDTQWIVLHRTEASASPPGCAPGDYEDNPGNLSTRIGPPTGTSGIPGEYGSYEDTAVTNGTAYCYTAFVYDGASYSGDRRASGRPFDSTGNVKWAFSTGEGGANLSPPGLNGHAYVVSEDTLYAVRLWENGGSWPSGWKPFRFYPASPALQRPTVTSAPIGPVPRVALVGTQGGRVYAFDGLTGTPLWQTDPLGPDTVVQAGISGLLEYFSGPTAPDTLLVGTVNGTTPNSFKAIDFSTGSTAAPYSFSGDGSDMGVIGGQAAVDSLQSRAFFASRTRSGGSSHTVWALELNGTGSRLLWASDLGDIDGSPTLRRSPAPSTLYVGTNDSSIYALDPDTGLPRWSFTASPPDGMVKSLVWPVQSTQRLYFATAGYIWAVDDTGTTTPPAAPVAGWPVPIPSPSTPVLFFNTLYVGSGDGHLYQIDPAGAVSRVMLGDGLAAVGTPSIDYHSYLVYVGTVSGHVYAVSVPF